MKIEKIIQGKVTLTISARESAQILVERLNSHHVGALVVTEDGKNIEGIVSERDVIRAMPGKFDYLSDLHVRDLMTVVVHTCTPDSSVGDVMSTMTRHRIRHMPVVDSDGTLISIISIGDVVKYHVDEMADENSALRDYLSASH
jgi:CBS domain-containing protein